MNCNSNILKAIEKSFDESSGQYNDQKLATNITGVSCDMAVHIFLTLVEGATDFMVMEFVSKYGFTSNQIVKSIKSVKIKRRVSSINSLNVSNIYKK